jgi:UDP-4-amino-4,6-dideoxy-N-acetyl-beta-L-altrosamine N-acetyltransferase
MIDFGYGVVLAPLNKKNNEHYNRWRNNREIWKWCRQFDVISLDHQDAWYDSQSKDPTIRMYQVQTKDKLVGVCGLTDINHVNQHAEFSLYIAPGEHGKGYGKAALNTLVDHGFNNLNLHHIFGETYDGNPAAKMFESVGFKFEGTRRQYYFRDGKFIDAHLYSILRSEQ